VAIAVPCAPLHSKNLHAPAPDIQPRRHRGAGNGGLQGEGARRSRPSRAWLANAQKSHRGIRPVLSADAPISRR
jgi:hypothetical protein